MEGLLHRPVRDRGRRAMLLVERLARLPASAALATRIAGGVVTGVGLVFLSEALLPS
jgi:hypothetical protein